MNPHFEIKEKKVIYEILDRAEYGTLALSVDDKPYAVPMNFVRINESIYFHGALKNRKMKMFAKNRNASFSVVENYSLIDSDFSKFKFGQHLNEERFEMIISNLEARGREIDIATARTMREQRGL